MEVWRAGDRIVCEDGTGYNDVVPDDYIRTRIEEAHAQMWRAQRQLDFAKAVLSFRLREAEEEHRESERQRLA